MEPLQQAMLESLGKGRLHHLFRVPVAKLWREGPWWIASTMALHHQRHQQNLLQHLLRSDDPMQSRHLVQKLLPCENKK